MDPTRSFNPPYSPTSLPVSSGNSRTFTNCRKGLFLRLNRCGRLESLRQHAGRPETNSYQPPILGNADAPRRPGVPKDSSSIGGSNRAPGLGPGRGRVAGSSSRLFVRRPWRGIGKRAQTASHSIKPTSGTGESRRRSVSLVDRMMLADIATAACVVTLQRFVPVNVISCRWTSAFRRGRNIPTS